MNDTEFEHTATRLRPRLTAAAIHTARSLHLTDADAEDAVQETLVRLWRMGDRLALCSSIEGMARTIVRNVCIDMSRRAVADTTTIDHLPIADAAEADSSLTAESTRGEVDRLVARLPATQQRLLRMRGEGMSLDDIAAVVQMPKTSVKTLIARARRTLLEKLKDNKI